MTYFIVDTPYETCFSIFFQQELGYPNFYSIPELLPTETSYPHLTLVAPYRKKEYDTLEKISRKIQILGLKSLKFGENLDTPFIFQANGQCYTHPLFRQTLTCKVNEFLKVNQVS